jgi:hypothetical protein
VIVLDPIKAPTVRRAFELYATRLRHIRIGADHRNKPVVIFAAGAEVRVVTEEGELLRTLTIDPTRDYQPLNGRWPVHNVLRQASAMS